MTPSIIATLSILESKINAEHKELCLLVIELAKQVEVLQKEIKTIKGSPEMMYAKLLIPLGGKPK